MLKESISEVMFKGRRIGQIKEEEEEGKACSFLGPRGVIEGRRKKKKQTVFKHGVQFSLSGLQQEAFAPLPI